MFSAATFTSLCLTLALSPALPGDLYVDSSANCAAGNGSASAPFCTLAEALQVAADGDRILVAAGQYSASHLVEDNVIIVGAGDAPGGTTLAGGFFAGALLRIGAGKTVSVEGVRFTNGIASSAASSAVDNSGTLTLRNSTIVNGSGSGGRACVIYQRPGSGGLTLERCSISNNYVNSSSGSVLRAQQGGDVTIRESAFTGNTVYQGSVLYAFGSFVRIDDTTFESNQNFAQAVLTVFQSNLVMRNSTIASNRGAAVRSGAAGGTQSLESCTVYGNARGYVLHGIESIGPSPFRLRNTIVAGGHPPAQTFRTLTGSFLSLGNNLIDNSQNSSGFVDGVNGDLVGTPPALLRPELGPLAPGAGFGRSHEPGPTSPALDRGSATTALSLDQRRFPRLSGAIDIGAVERPLGGNVVGCVPVANSSGVAANLRASGAFSLATNRVRLLANQVPSGALSLFLASLSSAAPGTPPGSSGALCLGGAIGRFVGPGQVQNATPEGTAQLDLNLLALPQPTGAVAAAAGQSWYFQAWYRDALGGQATSNFTAALELRWN